MTALRTARLTLTPFRAADARDLFAVRGDPQAMTFWDWPGDVTLKQTADVAHGMLREVAAGDALYWTARLEDGGFAGVLDLSELKPLSADMGFLVRRSLWGGGYGREACAAVIAFAWESGRTRLESRIHVGNDRSEVLLRRLGFARERVEPREVRPGVLRDCAFMVLERPG